MSFTLERASWHSLGHWTSRNFTKVTGPWIFVVLFYSLEPIFLYKASRILPSFWSTDIIVSTIIMISSMLWTRLISCRMFGNQVFCRLNYDRVWNIGELRLWWYIIVLFRWNQISSKIYIGKKNWQINTCIPGTYMMLCFPKKTIFAIVAASLQHFQECGIDFDLLFW